MATQTPDLPAAPLDATVPHGPDPVAQTLALLQPWIDYVPKRQRRLGIFIFLALLAHLVAFFFIRIDTTRAELRHQARTHVTMENPPPISQEGHPSDLFWDHLTDPRLFILPMGSLASLPFDGPSPDLTSLNPNIGPQQLPPPAQAGDYQFIHQAVPPLEQQVLASMTPARQGFTYDETPPAIRDKTTWQWDAPLAQRQPTGAPDLPLPISDTDLIPTELNIAVGANGTVQHVLVEQGCGKLELDQLAVLAARKIRFRPGGQTGLLWGRITIFWHYSAQPREEVIPTPLSPP